MFTSDLLLQFLITLPALLISMVLHEVSHGYVAYRLGDRTARQRGRLSLNPLKHLDKLGSLMLCITYFGSGGSMLFGWAKPVPINPGNFKDPQRGMMCVGAAGPAANLLITIASALALKTAYPYPVDSNLFMALFLVFRLNLILMVFNLIPVPPLDGSRIVGGFLSRQAYVRWIQMDQYGMMFVMLLMFVLIGPLGAGFSSFFASLYHIFLPASYGF